METCDFLILGGGIIGLSLARELARVSKSVVVVERGRAGAAASSAAAGLLTPALATAPAGPLLELCHDSAALYPAWLDELRADGAGDVGFERGGFLEVWTDTSEADEGRRTVSARTRPERGAEFLTAQDLGRMEPALTPDVAGGVLFRDDMQVDPARLSAAVARVAALAGVSIREGETVRRLVLAGDRVEAVHAGTTRYHPGTVVLAAGAWSGQVVEGLPLHVPVRPVKGQMFLAECRVSPVRTPMHAGEAMLIPRRDGTLLLGVTVEEAGFDERVTLAGLRQILAGTAALVPAVGEASPLRGWAGLRPATPDAAPLMGPLPPPHNLWVSAGHFRKGILLAPLCARLTAQSILANRLVEDLAPFKATRRIE